MSSFWSRLAATEFGDFLVKELRRAADAIEALQPSRPTLALPVVFKLGEEQQVGEITVNADEGNLGATVAFLDSEGNATTADDVPQWSSSDESVATAVASEDGLSATFEIGAPGATVIEVRSQNTDGSEVVSQGTITVQPGDAVIGSVEFELAESGEVVPAEEPPVEEAPVEEAPVEEAEEPPAEEPAPEEQV